VHQLEIKVLNTYTCLLEFNVCYANNMPNQ